MRQLLICDDEVKVCQLLKNILPWTDLGIEITGTAYDGLQAMEIIRQRHPDIVLTDIRMPGIDGIELIRQAKELDADISFIILSGYQLFDYAHNAIKYGVEDYLLKPVDEKELLQVITKTLAKKEKTEYRETYVEDLEEQIRENYHQRKRFFIADILDKKTLPTRERLLKEYGIAFSYPFYTAFFLHPLLNREQYTEDSQRILVRRIAEICREELKTFENSSFSAEMYHGYFSLFNLQEENLGNCLEKLSVGFKNVIRQTKYLNDLFPDSSIYIGRSSVSGDYGSIPELLREAEIAAYSHLTEYVYPMTEYREGKFPFPDYEFQKTPASLEFEAAVEHLDAKRMEDAFFRMNQEYRAMRPCGCAVREFYERILQEFVNKSLHYHFDMDADQIRKFRNRILLCDTADEIYQILTDYMKRCLEQRVKEKEAMESKPILQIKEYIQNHYEGNISLEEIGRRFGFNPTYVSQLFKAETGMNFKDYLLDIRLSEAKRMLQYTDEDMESIARKVGYTDFKHFSKLFRKNTDLSPKQYRKIYHI